jgi:hypothetical protein
VSGLTWPDELTTRETVAIETPALRATSAIFIDASLLLASKVGVGGWRGQFNLVMGASQVLILGDRRR